MLIEFSRSFTGAELPKSYPMQAQVLQAVVDRVAPHVRPVISWSRGRSVRFRLFDKASELPARPEDHDTIIAALKRLDSEIYIRTSRAVHGKPQKPE